ncbi:hypothetical protein BH09PSE6_BH09PSE6_09040 [soil metagenome]
MEPCRRRRSKPVRPRIVTLVGVVMAVLWLPAAAALECPVPGNGGCAAGPASLPSLAVAVLQAGNPVHLGDGNKYQREVDLPVRPRPLGLELVRHYNSRSGYRGIFGVGWRMSYETVASVDATGVQIVQADGRRIGFARDPRVPSRCLASSSADGRVHLLADGRLVWHWPDGRRLEFAASGRLERIVAAGARIVSLSYDARGHLARVTDPAGESLTFEYEAGAVDARRLRVASVDGPAASWRYRYDRLDNLVEVVAVIDGRASTSRLRYDLEAGGGDPHNLTSVEHDAGTAAARRARYDYDERDRVVRTRNPALGIDLHIDYGDDGRRVRVTDGAGATTEYAIAIIDGRYVLESSRGAGCNACPPAGLQVSRAAASLSRVRIGRREWRWQRDASHRLVAIEAADVDGTRVQRLSFDYASRATTPFRMLASPTSMAAMPRVPVIGWSALDLDRAARPLRLVDPAGHQVVLVRDSNGRLLERVDRSGSTRLRYDGAGRLVELVAPDRVMRIEWGRFGLPERLSGGALDERFARDDEGRLLAGSTTVAPRLTPVAWRPVVADVDIGGWSYQQRLQRVLQQAAFDATSQLAETLRLLAQAPTLAAAARAMRVWAAAGMTPQLWLGPARVESGYATVDETALDFIGMNRSTFGATMAAQCLSDLDGAARVLADLASQAIAELGIGADAQVARLFDALYSMQPTEAWQSSPLARGRRIEQALGQNLPDNYPVIDAFDAATARGRAITSFDLAAPSHADGARLLQDLVDRIDTLAAFEGVDWGGVDTRGRLTARTFSLVVEGPGSAAQQRALQDAQSYAESVGIDWQLIVMP